MTEPVFVFGAYRLVLGLYPADFRRTVGAAMLHDLREGWYRARQVHGRTGALRFAFRQIVDLMGNVGLEWRTPSGPRVPAARMGPGPWLRAAAQDVIFAARALRRDPMFTGTVVLVVGLGITAVVTIFGMLDAILLEPMPYPGADRIVSMAESYRVSESKSVAYPNYVDWRERNRVFEDISARSWSTFNLTGEGPALSVWGMGATPNFLPLFGVTPVRGRLFTAEEVETAERVVVLSEGFWRDRLGSVDSVLGRELRLDGNVYAIIGVVPEFAEFPLAGAEFWVPLSLTIGPSGVDDRSNHPGIEAFAKALPGVTVEQARADLDRVAAELAVDYPDTNTDAGVLMTPLKRRVVSDSGTTLWTLFAAVSVVMMGVCANVASLMLARSTRRGGELAVRAALGAGRARLVRQMLAEGAVLSSAAGLLGLVAAAVFLRLVRSADWLDLPRLVTVDVDLSVAAFALGAALISGLLFAAAPALRLGRVEPAAALRGAAGGRGATLDGRKGRAALVVAQVAFAVVLLAGAGLMARSLQNLSRADLGMSPANVITAYVGPPQSQYPTDRDRAQLYRAFADRLETLPGVRRVAAGDPLPMSGRNTQTTLSDDGFPQIEQLGQRVDVARITPGYFDVLGVRLLAGRDFRHDDSEENRVVIIDETLADFLWPGSSALGNRLRFRGPAEERPWFTVVGVAEHVKNYGVRNESRYELYLPYTISAWGMSMLVETDSTSATAGIVAGMREELSRLDAQLPLTRVATLREYIDDSVASEKLVGSTLIGFAAASLLVAIIGLYGVIAYSVAQRTQEFGIRMALGAQRGRVLRNVLWEGALLVATGVVLGFGGALATGRLLANLLYGVQPSDPATLASVAAIVSVVSLLAVALPARQAVRVDPAVALRD